MAGLAREVGLISSDKLFFFPFFALLQPVNERTPSAPFCPIPPSAVASLTLGPQLESSDGSRHSPCSLGTA